MREAIREYVEREEKRGALKAAALAAWETFATPGAHVAADEADDWLARLEAGEEAQPPECHG